MGDEYPTSWVVKALNGAGKLVKIFVFARSKSEAESRARQSNQVNKTGIKEIKSTKKAD